MLGNPMKIIQLLFVILVMTVPRDAVGASTTIQWQTPNPGLDNALVDESGTLINVSSNWLIQMYIDDLSASTNQTYNSSGNPTIHFGTTMNPNILGTAGVDNPSGTDMAVAGTAKSVVATLASGSFFELLSPAGDAPFDYDLVEGQQVYSVLFNASTIASATSWAIIDDSTFFMPNQPALPSPELSSVSYSVGTLASNDWVAVVPEPSSMLTTCLGLSLLLIRRRR